MVKIESKTLDEAYIEASKQLNCSITDLNVEIIQNPSNGIFGLFKKSAIIIATAKKSTVAEENNKSSIEKKVENIKVQTNKENFIDKEIKQSTVINDNFIEKKAEDSIKINTEEIKKEESVDIKESISKNEIIAPIASNAQQGIFDTFYSEKTKISRDDSLLEIKNGINNMFKHSCFDVSDIKIEYFDENTIYVEIRGNDAALLIGKDGYRYKALSYMLFNWINSKYNLMLRLEIAEFLKNQEEMMSNFLTPFIEKVKKEGKGQTKPLDGVLVHIALTQLRDVFPNKYVSVRTNSDGEKFVIINDFKSSVR